MKKTVLPLLLCLVLLLSLAGCAGKSINPAVTPVPATDAAPAATDAPVGLPNPLHDVADYTSLLIATPGVLLSDAPDGATNVSYLYIDGEPVIAEINFTYGGHDYCYRAALSTGDVNLDIAGVYEDFNKFESHATDGGSYTLKYVTGKDLGVANWYNATTNCVYSLYSETGCGIDEPIKDVVDKLLPVNILVNGKPLVYVTPEPVATPAATKDVQGRVASIEENSLLLNLENGSTVAFLLSNLAEAGVKAGDTISISYAGDILDSPEALTVTLVKAGNDAKTISGTVVLHDDTSVFVSTATDDAYGFVLNNRTVYQGASRELKLGNAVTVTYTGDLSNAPVATVIDTMTVSDTEEAKTPENDPSLIDKRLRGTVTELSSRKFTIVAGSGYRYTFYKDGDTVMTGSYDLEVGASVRVTYDGYASDSPMAKKVQVMAPPDPTPPSTHTIHGTVTMQAGNALVVETDSGRTYSFLLRAPDVSGSGGVGSTVRVTFTDDGGDFNVTRIVYETPIVY